MRARLTNLEPFLRGVTRRNVLAAVAGLFGTARAGASTKNRGLTRAIDRIGNDAIGSKSAAGLAVQVQRVGVVLYSKGFGFADIAAGVPATPHTIFRVGSVTKQFTAAAMLALAEEGKLSLDDPLSKYLPDFPRAREVALRRLLNHTSGIGNLRQGIAPTRDYSMAEMIKIIERQNPLYGFDPGTRWAYSNTAFTLAGAVIERVTGASYWQAYKELFARAGMTDTAVDHQNETVPRRATGYEVGSNGFEPAYKLSWTIPGPAGCLHSTVGDLARWHDALFHGRVLSRASVTEMTTPSRLKDGRLASKGRNGPAEGSQPEQEYGLGLELSLVDGKRRCGHYGSIPGFGADMGTFPELGLTIVALTNTDFGPKNPPRAIDRAVLAGLAQ